MKRNLSLLFVPLALAAVVATVGCGSSDKSSTTSTTPTTSTSPSTGGGSAVNLTLAADANGQLRFDKTKLTAKAGKVTITMDNPSNLPHSIALKSEGGSGVDEMGTGGAAGVAHGQKSVLTADLNPGTYKYYCPVNGHEGAGMVGTLTVK